MKIIGKPTMQSEKMKIENPTLPYDIILEILHRLPAKSLLRFTSVSKSWKASIKSSNFVSAHRQINKNISCSHFVYFEQHALEGFTLIPEQHGLEGFTLIPESRDGVRTQIPCPSPLWRSRLSVLGSSEGLVCLKTCYGVCLWNPFIRTMKEINPVVQFVVCNRLGFGFAPQSRDYKIVKLLVEWEGEGEYLTGAEMYSLSSDSWTRIESPAGRLERSKISRLCSQVSFKGSIYWLVNLHEQNMILRIDLDKQTIEEMEIDAVAINLRTNIMEVNVDIMVVDGFLVLLKSDIIRGNKIIPVQSYLYKESKSGSSSWNPIRMGDLPKGEAVGLTSSGHIILVGTGGQIFACDPYYDGTYLSFRLRDLGIRFDAFNYDRIVSIKETLHLLDDETACDWKPMPLAR